MVTNQTLGDYGGGGWEKNPRPNNELSSTLQKALESLLSVATYNSQTCSQSKETQNPAREFA